MSDMIRPGRQPDPEMRARELAVDDVDGTAVRLDEFPHDGQADTRATHQPALWRGTLVERVEDARALVDGDAPPKRRGVCRRSANGRDQP